MRYTNPRYLLTYLLTCELNMGLNKGLKVKTQTHRPINSIKVKNYSS